MSKRYFVYILGNERPTIYIGVISNLSRRIYQHKRGIIEGFTKKYKLKKLLYFEEFDDIENAISREKQLKNWHREWKLKLIKSTNPDFEDLFKKILK